MTPPPYRSRLTTGVVHFGPGAFHRAHQADYVDRLLHHDPRWGIAAVSLRSAGTVERLKQQDGIYTLAILDADVSFRTIGAHSRFLGPSESSSIRSQLLDPAVRIVTSTVTEKGYCLAADGTLDFDHPEIARDLLNPDRPSSLIGWLALGLAERRAQRIQPFTPICCDNMTQNGRKLHDAVIAFCQTLDPELARWIDGEVRFPETMVDSITPATDEKLRRLVRERTGVSDEMPVAREAFVQWVIEDVLPAGSPDLRSAGVTFTKNVAAWEGAKLRILNGAHSTLAYIGLLLGHDTVADAMSDPVLSSFVRRLAFDDIIPTLQPSPIDLQRYAEETLERFRNPAIKHRLTQIAWDGSQKIPYRLLDTITDAQTKGRPIERLAVPLAAWILFIERQARGGAIIVDPLADQLAAKACSDDPVNEILEFRAIFPECLATNAKFRASVLNAVTAMRASGVAAALAPDLTTDA